jgi:hypothetical protein
VSFSEMVKFSEDPPEEEDDPAPELDIATICRGRKTERSCAAAACRDRENRSVPRQRKLETTTTNLEGQRSAR